MNLAVLELRQIVDFLRPTPAPASAWPTRRSSAASGGGRAGRRPGRPSSGERRGCRGARPRRSAGRRSIARPASRRWFRSVRKRCQGGRSLLERSPEHSGRLRLPLRLTSGSRNASGGSPFPARRPRSSASMTAAQMCLQISAAIDEVGAVAGRAKRVPVPIDFDPVVAPAAHHGVRRPLAAADRDDGAHAMVAKAFSPNRLRNRTGEVPSEHRMNQYD